MKVLYHTIWLIAMVFIAGTSLSSCVYDDEVDSDESDNIRINTVVVNGSRTARVSETDDNRFVVLFWRKDDLASLENPNRTFPVPYLSKEAPQSVDFYSQTVYDTGYPYPYPETTMLYATGYAPAPVLTSEDNFRTLIKVNENDPDKGRHDFLGCDLWPEVYKGSQQDPFAKEKNKLYFRHLAAKLKFYADRDKESMENKQFVRNVRITNLRMRIDDGNDEVGWGSMYTPNVFEWRELTNKPEKPDESDFTKSYNNVIAKVKQIGGNTSVDTNPKAGYKATEAETFAGSGASFVLCRNASDRVPISGMYIDSCYVCNPIVDGEVSIGQPIRLKMDISAELSFHPDFPLNDSGDGASTTDDLTFTRTWTGVELKAIYPLGKDGKVNTTADAGKVRVFKPGNEYRVYIHFYRTGVNLTAMEMPWNPGGVHYITISGGDKQPADGDKQPTDDKQPADDKQPTDDKQNE